VSVAERARAQARNGATPIEEWPYEYAVLPIDSLFVDPSYQREALPAFIRRIMANFDPHLVGVLLASKRPDGRYALIDGQQRWTALKAKRYKTAPCLVYNVEPHEEAWLFAKFGRERRNLNSWATFRGFLAAGDPHALAIKAAVEDAGLKIGKLRGENTIGAVAALEDVYKRNHPDGREALLWSLEFLGDAFPNNKRTWEGDLIRAAGRLYKTYTRDELNTIDLTLAAGALGLEKLNERAVERKRTEGRSQRSTELAHVLVRAYNEHTTNERRVDERF
jgi:hypothetical protein